MPQTRPGRTRRMIGAIPDPRRCVVDVSTAGRWLAPGMCAPHSNWPSGALARRMRLCSLPITGDTMLNRRIAICSMLALASVAATAQTYPSKPITFVVPNPPGGVVDSSARLVGDPLTRLLGQAVVIENKGGASGNIAYQQVAR